MTQQTRWMADRDRTLLAELLRAPTEHMMVGGGALQQHGGDAQRLVRRLKRFQAYAGWRLEVDRRAVGMDVTAFIFVKLKRQDAQTLQSFRENLSEQRQVIRMASLSGEFDFMLEFVGRCVAELNDFRSNYLNACDLIKGTTTLISLE